MKILFWVVALFALAVGLVIAARYNEGYALVVLPPYRVEIALNLLVILVVAAFILFYSLVRLVSGAVQVPARVRQYRVSRRHDRAREALLTALESYFEGRYARAEQSAMRSIALGEHQRLSRVIAARAAHELRAYERRDEHLRALAEGLPADDALRVVTEAELLLDERRAQDALDALKVLPRKHTAALKLEFRAQRETRQWESALTVLGELERRQVFDEADAARLKNHAIVENLRRKASDARALDETWRKLPDAQKRESTVAAAAAQCYIALGRGDDAQRIIEQSLGVRWDSQLVALYGKCGGSDTVRQIETAETWLGVHPGDAALLLTLAQLCARQNLWGKAQTYLEASISVEPTYASHLELARLHERLGNADTARRHYRASLDHALARLENPALPATVDPP